MRLEDLKLPDGTPMMGPDGLLVPPARSFSMVVNAATRIYSYRSDEAMRDNFIAARAMRRDAFIRGLLEERILPTINRRWQLEVDDANDPVQKYVRDALTRTVENIDGFDSFKRALLDGVWFGKAGCQWAYAQDKDNNNLWGLSRWDPIHGDSIQNTYDGVPAIMLDTMTTGWYASHGAKWGSYDGDLRPTDRGGTALVLNRPYWRERFAIHIHMREKADYLEGELAGSVQGLGLRGLVYWQYVVRTDALTWMLAYMQAVGQMDLLVFNYPAGNAAAKAKAEENAAKVIGKAAISCPRNPQGNWPAVEQISMNEAGLRALHQLVADYFDRHIERLIVGQSMSSGADHGSGLGGTGRAEFTKATKDEILIHDTNRLDETLTRDLIGPLKRYNFPWARFPVRFKSTLPDLDKAAKVASGATLIQNGVSIKVDEWREAAGFTRPEPGDEVIGGMAGMMSQIMGAAGGMMGPPPGPGGMPPPGMMPGGPGGMPMGAGAGGMMPGGMPLGPGGMGGPPVMSSALGVSGPPNRTLGHPGHPGAVRHAGEGAPAPGPVMGYPGGSGTYIPGWGRKYGFGGQEQRDRFGFTRYQAGPYKYASTQINLTGDAYIKIAWMAGMVADGDLAPDGREDTPHVTVRYGLLPEVKASDVARVLSGAGPIRFHLGKISIFPGEEHDVLKVDVSSDDLHRLHKKLGALPNVQTYPEYKPHATIAYVKPGRGAYYARVFKALDLVAYADTIVFSTADKKKTDILLKPADVPLERQPHQYARHALRAPRGGLAVRNQLFRGGRFIPSPPPAEYAEWDDVSDSGGMSFPSDSSVSWHDEPMSPETGTVPTGALVPSGLVDEGRSAFDPAFIDWFGDLPTEGRHEILEQLGLDPSDFGPNELRSRAWAQASEGWRPPGAITDPPPTPAQGSYWTPERSNLSNAQIVGGEALDNAGVNTSVKLVFADGSYGVFKPQEGEDTNLRAGVPEGGQHRREVAASVVADLLGFGDLVPATSYRNHSGLSGSVQRYVDGIPAKAVGVSYRMGDHAQAARAALFDYIIGNTDRHAGNWLVAGHDPATNRQGKIQLIDHGLSFPVRHFAHDFYNKEFLKFACGVWNLPIPDMSGMAEAWPQAEEALREVGIEEEAIQLARQRFQAVASGQFRTFSELPAFFHRGSVGRRPSLKESLEQNPH